MPLPLSADTIALAVMVLRTAQVAQITGGALLMHEQESVHGERLRDCMVTLEAVGILAIERSGRDLSLRLSPSAQHVLNEQSAEGRSILSALVWAIMSNASGTCGALLELLMPDRSEIPISPRPA